MSRRVQTNSPTPDATNTYWLTKVLPGVLEKFPRASMVSQAVTNPAIIDYDWIRSIPLTVGFGGSSGADIETELDLMRASPTIFGRVGVYSQMSQKGLETGLERAFTELNDTVIDYHARNYAEARNGAAGYAFKTFVDNCFFFRRVLDNFFFIESVAFEDPRRNEYTALINMRPPYPHSETFVIHYNPQEGLASRFSMVLDIGDTVETGSFNQLVRNFFNHIGFDPWDTVDALKREGQGYLANQMLAALMHFKLERT